MNITPEMVQAWTRLQAYSQAIKTFVNQTPLEKEVIAAIDVIDNSDFMVPIEEVRDEMERAASLPVDPAEWGDVTATDMAAHQR